MSSPARSARSTERLTLVPLSTALTNGMWAASDASLPDLRPWMAWAHTASPEETVKFAARAEAQWVAGTAFHFAIVLDGEVIGGVGVEVRGPLDRLGELGYWVRTDRCGQGYATEASSSVVEFGFEEAGLHRLELRAGVDNRASQRVAEKLGFQQEGRLRQGGRGAEVPYDCYVYGLLVSDPRSQRPVGKG